MYSSPPGVLQHLIKAPRPVAICAGLILIPEAFMWEKPSSLKHAWDSRQRPIKMRVWLLCA
jgi:hypothetical protein